MNPPSLSPSLSFSLSPSFPSFSPSLYSSPFSSPLLLSPPSPLMMTVWRLSSNKTQSPLICQIALSHSAEMKNWEKTNTGRFNRPPLYCNNCVYCVYNAHYSTRVYSTCTCNGHWYTQPLSVCIIIIISKIISKIIPYFYVRLFETDFFRIRLLFKEIRYHVHVLLFICVFSFL